MPRRPRLTDAVRSGWQEIRAYITCELDAAVATQFECEEANRRMAESGDPEANPPDPETCRCRGCVASRHAWRAIEWIDARLEED